MTDSAPSSAWLPLPDDVAGGAGGRWAIAAGEDGRPKRRGGAGGSSVYPAALLDGEGRPLVHGELVVQDVWPTLRPMGQESGSTNAALDAAWSAARAGDPSTWSLGEIAQKLAAGPVLVLRDGAYVADGKVARDDAKLEAAGLPAYSASDRRFTRDAGDFRELSPDGGEDALNPGGGRMTLRPAATATLAEHVKAIEHAVADGSLLLAGRDVGTRWIEATHLKIALMASILDGLVARDGDAPLGRLTIEDVEVLAGGDGPAARWDATARLCAPPAVTIGLVGGGRVHLAPPANGSWPEADRSMRLDAADNTLRPHEPLAVPEGGAVRVRIDQPPLDLVAAPAGGESLAPAIAVPEGPHAARVAVLPGRTRSEDAEDLGRLFLELLAGPVEATATAGELVALVRRLLKADDGEKLRLDVALRKAIEADDDLKRLLGPHRLVGGWLDDGSDADSPAAAAVPMNVWSRLLTGCASLLPPFSGSDPAARLEALQRTLASLNRLTESLLTGTWQIDREVASVIAGVAEERGLVAERS